MLPNPDDGDSDAPAPRRRLIASFRDPSGILVRCDGRILRFVSHSGSQDLLASIRSKAARTFVESTRLVRSRVLDPPEADRLSHDAKIRSLIGEYEFELVVEHEPVLFQSLPCEWPPEMLHAAAEATLDLHEALLQDGLGLKDATPHNILFQGPHPVFVDALSIERRNPKDTTWLAHAQFTRCFLLPLLVSKYFALPLDTLLWNLRDGLEPEAVYRMSRFPRKLLPPFLTLVTFPTWLGKSRNSSQSTLYKPRLVKDSGEAEAVLRALVRHLRRQLRKLAPAPARSSPWSDYRECTCHGSEYRGEKAEFLRTVLTEFRPASMLDIGCNTGEYSILAARAGVKVLALDGDPTVVGSLYRMSRDQNLDILPLVINLAQPTPGAGWLNRESPSFLERVRKKFDAVIMMAVIHHLLVADRVPLPWIIDLLADWTTDILVIEYVDPKDPQFQLVARGRDQLFTHLNHAFFEECCRRRFDIVMSRQLSLATRRLYLLRNRNEKSN